MDDPAHPASILLDPVARAVIAHRGASAYAPENTLPAFALARRQGADAVELDVRLSADGVPVVMHDATVDRTTDGTGPVAAMTVAQLTALDAGWRFSRDGGRTFPWRGRGVRVPTLGEVLEATPDLPLLVEVKEVEAQEPVRAVVEQAEATARVIAASEHHAALACFREPPHRAGGSRRDIVRHFVRTLLGLGPRIECALLSVPYRWRGLLVPGARFVSAARRRGVPVHVWTVDDPAIARRLWRQGAAGMVTNVPDVMVAVRSELGAGPALRPGARSGDRAG